MTDSDSDADAEADVPAEGWRVVDAETEYETGWYTGGYDLLEQPDGTRKRYYWADLPDAVVVVARDGDELLFVDQFRPVIRAQCLELPAGIVEADESYEDAAARELREETGFDPDETVLLQRAAAATGVLRHERGFVVATGLTESDAGRELDSNEFLTVERVPVEDAVAVARDQPANDATLEGVLLAKEEGLLRP